MEMADDQCKFTTKGQFDDAVEFQLGDEEDKKLYASRSVLSCMSPVFKAMFQHDFEEKRNNAVRIEKDFCRDDFLEFLEYLDPTTWKSINVNTYLKTAQIADKYQCVGLIQRFQRRMKKQLKRATEACNPNTGILGQLPHVLTCLKILRAAHALNYEDILTTSVDSVARFSPKLHMYDGITSFSYYTYSCHNYKERESIYNECIQLFSELPLVLSYFEESATCEK